MKIEVGKYYKTREGLKVRIYALDGMGEDIIHGAILSPTVLSPSEGWIQYSWIKNGSAFSDSDSSEYDIVGEWEEPLDFDWDSLPKWADKYIAMDEGGRWYSYKEKPIIYESYWEKWGSQSVHIDVEYHPKYKGGWENSLHMNPRYK